MKPSTLQGTSTRRRGAPRSALVAMAVCLGLTGVALTGCTKTGSGADPQLVAAATDSQPMTYPYSGAPVSYQVPDGVTSVQISAVGGAGGNTHEDGFGTSGGAAVDGTIAVVANQQLLVSVGGAGESAGTSDHDPQGGWGGVGARGGNGNAADDDLRTSGAGGGASTVQLTDVNGHNPQTILIAGGGGANGGVSGDPSYVGTGGTAGCTDPSDTAQPSWTGSGGTDGSSIKGGKGGKAAGQTGMAGARGGGGSGLGGNGGGGGGGANGGNPGTGASLTSAGGGGGAGSSATYGMTNTTVACQVNSDGNGVGNGWVILSPQNS